MKKKLVEKFISVEKEIADEKGTFVLFGVFNREDAPYDRWDVVISSPWIDKNRSKTLNYIIDKMSSKLSSDELTHFKDFLLKP